MLRCNAIPGVGPNYMTEVTLEALMALRGQRFIEASFSALLGRAPDPEGLAYYRSRLARGVDRLDVLRDLQASGEARSYHSHVKGLKNAMNKQRGIRIPIIGSLLCLATHGYSKRAQVQFNILAEHLESLSSKMINDHNLYQKQFLEHPLVLNDHNYTREIELKKDFLVESPSFDEINLRSFPKRSLSILKSIS